jgi:hypothetical protein
MWLRTTLGTAAILILAAVVSAQAQPAKQPTPPDVEKAMKAVRAELDAAFNAKGAGDITWKSEEALKNVLPDYYVINVRFRQFPVARILPKGLHASNLFVVKKDDKSKPTPLLDITKLEKFLHDNASEVKNEKEAGTLLAAWLTLTQELRQDGFFRFEVMEKEFKVVGDNAKFSAEGRAMVVAGGNGQLKAELTTENGKLAKVTQQVEIRQGPRPICQATKLLDADPIVRRIAEADLLIMGLPARDYLMEQRDRATPELQRAIDRLWARIQKNGW